MGTHERALAIKEEEESLWHAYEELVESASGEVERRIAEQIRNFQRLQLMSLDLLAGPVPERFLGFGTIRSADVNLREGPGGSYKLLAKLRKGEPVIVQEYTGYWIRVQIPRGKEGYVFKDYVEQEATF